MPTSAGWQAFSRLSAAVTRHKAQTQPGSRAFPGDANRELYAERDLILQEIAPKLPARPPFSSTH